MPQAYYRRRRCLRSVTGACERSEYPRWGTLKHRTLEGCPSNELQSMPGVGALFQSATTHRHQSGGIRYAQTTRLPSGDAFSVIKRVKFLKLPSGDAFSVIPRVKFFKLPSGDAFSVMKLQLGSTAILPQDKRVKSKSPHGLSHFSFNPTSWSFPPYSLTLIKLRKSHLGNSSELKRVFFLVARQRLSKLIFTLTPASVDCTRFGVGSHFSFHRPSFSSCCFFVLKSPQAAKMS